MALVSATVVVAGMVHGLPATAGGAELVDIRSYRFDPGDITVPAGGEVTWTNHDRAAHDVTFASDGSLHDVSSGSLVTGDSFSFTFRDAGTVAYVCSVHPDMHGSVTVVALDAPPSTAADDALRSSPAPQPQVAVASATPAPATPVPAPALVESPRRTRLSIDPRFLLAAALTGVIVTCALLLGRGPSGS